MWRSYDMADGRLEMDKMVDPDTTPESPEPVRTWILPRLVLRTESERSDRMVRIPPGFLSC